MNEVAIPFVAKRDQRFATGKRNYEFEFKSRLEKR